MFTGLVEEIGSISEIEKREAICFSSGLLFFAYKQNNNN